MIKRLIERLFRRTTDPLPMLDHVPVQTKEVVREGVAMDPDARRVEKLIAARAAYGRAFKCARREFDREVLIVPGVIRTVHGYSEPTKGVVDRGNVRTIRRTAG